MQKPVNFQKIESDYQFNPTPLVLVDVSGSTLKTFKESMSVCDYEFSVAQLICRNNGYTSAHLITWSTTSKMYKNVTIEQFMDIRSQTESSGCIL